jgi:WhiB family transcriptional regulator, redox-sensing transcriptional regulator
MRGRPPRVKLPPPTLDAWEWQLEAQCRTMPISTFYPDPGLRGATRYRAEHAAKAVCEQCKVAVQCLAHAIRCAEPFGIWGGLNERERAARTDAAPRRSTGRI